jgi:hypothetical protein
MSIVAATATTPVFKLFINITPYRSNVLPMVKPEMEISALIGPIAASPLTPAALNMGMAPMLTEKFAADKVDLNNCTSFYTLYNLVAVYEFRQYPIQDIPTSECQ